MTDTTNNPTTTTFQPGDRVRLIDKTGIEFCDVPLGAEGDVEQTFTQVPGREFVTVDWPGYPRVEVLSHRLEKISATPSIPTRKIVISQDVVFQSDIEIDVPDVDAILSTLEEQVAALQTAVGIDLVETGSLGHYVRCQGQSEALDGVQRLIENLRG